MSYLSLDLKKKSQNLKKQSSVNFFWLLKFRYLQLLSLSLLVQEAQSWKEMLHLSFLHLDHLSAKAWPSAQQLTY